MKFKQNRLLLGGLTLSLALSLLATPAMALEYDYQGEAPGQNFHQSTSTDQNYVGDNGQIVVGTDGVVSGGVTGNQTSGPLSTVDGIAVGDYPEAYGFETDVDIANNSVFPNELGPTTQNSNYYRPTFIPTVESGSLPVGNSYTYSPSVAMAASLGYTGYAVPASTYGYRGMTTYNNVAGVYNSYVGASPVVGNGQYMGLATAAVSMPTITRGGAIGRLSIPSINLNRYIYEGTSNASLNKGIAHFDSTSGWLGNVGLAGHNRGSSAAFHGLKNVQVGDSVKYTTAYGTLTYVVSSVTTVAVTDTSGLQQDGTNKLTMYCCVENQPQIRLCVVATLVG